MNDLPSGWTEAALSDIALVTAGQAPPGTSYNSYSEGLPLFQGKTDFGALHLREPRLWTTNPSKIAESEDVLLSVRAPVGPTNLAATRCAIGRGLAAIRGYEGISQKYLLYALRASEQQLVEHATGTTFSAITSGVVRDHRIPVAPAAEQERIVAVIEEQFSRLDAGVVALGKARQSLKRMRAAMLTAAVSSTQEGAVPRVPLGDLVAPGRKIGYGVLVPGDHVSDGVPLVRIGDLNNRVVSSHALKRIAPGIEARYPRTRLQGGETLLSLVGTIGRTAVVPPDLVGANVARALAVIPVRETVDPRYVAIALSRDSVTRELTALSHEVARKTLNLEDVRRYAIPLPSYSRQLEIVQIVETAETWITSIEAVIDRSLRRAEHLRNSVLSAAFSGELTPQDQSDEPASVTLEKIAAERMTFNAHKPRRTSNSRMRQKQVNI